MPKRILTGKIVSNKMQKTVVVAVTSIKAHPKYKKRFKSTKKYQAHYEGEALNIGDTVMIEESKPISKNKNWILKDVVRSISSSSEENIK
ncbi:MAG: 30S ribosomal protein S17 [bacterium]|nr:30S ribosomal protein S17 [bacterium]